MPLLVSRAPSPLEGVLVLAATIALLAALISAPVLLPLAVALYGAELVFSVHRGEVGVWGIPLLAAGLLAVYEAGELRHRLPPGSAIEPGALRPLARRFGLTVALGLVGSAAVVGAAGLSDRGGPAAVVVGGLAVAGAVFIVRILTGGTRAEEVDAPRTAESREAVG